MVGSRTVGLGIRGWGHFKLSSRLLLGPHQAGIPNLGRSRLLDVVEGRTAKAVADWLADRDPDWLDGVAAVALDPHRGYYNTLVGGVPAATVVVDHFHAMQLGNRCVDEVRRRVQQAVHGHRGRKADPLYKIRRLLLTAAERLTARGWERLEAGWAAGDPHNEVYAAWEAKEALRHVYQAATLDDAPHRARRPLHPDRRRGRPRVHPARRDRAPLGARDPRLAHHRRTVHGRTEAVNLLVKKIKRVGHGFRNFANYRLRLLLHCGVIWHDAPTARIRSRHPRSAA